MSARTPTKNRTVSKELSLIFLCFLVILLVLSLFNVSLFLFPKQKTIHPETNLASLEQRVNFWYTFLESHPTYFSGWLEVAKLELKKGNNLKATEAFMKAEKINPNSSEIQQLSKDLGL